MSTVEVRWRRPGEKPHFFLLRRSQQGDPAGSVSVALVDVSGLDSAKWTDGGTPCAAMTADHTAVRFDLPGQAAAVRLEFTVAPQVNGVTGESLVLRQRLVVRDGALVPDRFTAPRYSVALRDRGGDDPLAQVVPSRVARADTVRAFTGAHPLVGVTKTGVSVDTEFLDVTNLWWELHFRLTPKNPPQPPQFSPWFLAPGIRLPGPKGGPARPGQTQPGQGRLAV
ncbi:MAG TPA: hypothetical protein VF163_00355, partial [Micromonosporaceae bacterium]